MTMTTSSPPHASRKRRKLTPQQIREVAAKSFCAIRTVESYLDGRRQWSTTAARITKAMAELGFSTS